MTLRFGMIAENEYYKYVFAGQDSLYCVGRKVMNLNLIARCMKDVQGSKTYMREKGTERKKKKRRRRVYFPGN